MQTIFTRLDFPCHTSAVSLAACGDSLAILRAMKDKQVDLIFADPPYNLGKDFGNRSDCWEKSSDYLNWCYAWIDESFRVLKDGGTFYIMNSTQNIPHIDVYLQKSYNVLARIIWYYDSSGVQSKKCFGSLYEPILMANKHPRQPYTFNWRDITVEAKTGARRRLIDYRRTPPCLYNTAKVPGNVWEIPRVRFKMPEYENHPTQKPEKLLERIVLTSSNPGDLVLDPFAGSFTTCAVALAHGRKAIGLELNPDYYKIGLRRTNILQELAGEKLTKTKIRKTANKSKADHLAQPPAQP
ncbi:MAG: adenine-specific DNA-methyltransferase [Negativicutes bacterium]|nr:adenine-specific DNA-methyltransferase [Negativicutes bacterium]